MRQEVCVSFWGNVRRGILGDDSLNQDKLTEEEEEEWKRTRIVLWYEVNVDALTSRLPDAKVCRAWEVPRDHVFQSGNRIIPVKNAQLLRGLINHWVGAKRFWKYMGSPPNALLGCADETNTWIRWENDQIWLAVWDLARFLR